MTQLRDWAAARQAEFKETMDLPAYSTAVSLDRKIRLLEYVKQGAALEEKFYDDDGNDYWQTVLVPGDDAMSRAPQYYRAVFYT